MFHLVSPVPRPVDSFGRRVRCPVVRFRRLAPAFDVLPDEGPGQRGILSEDERIVVSRDAGDAEVIDEVVPPLVVVVSLAVIGENEQRLPHPTLGPVPGAGIDERAQRVELRRRHPVAGKPKVL
ncbi:hypothetical protein, partial [Corynebacterium tuscaniense]|uniref:hypothetical protein n=1 Tax=Corynebacterium tuscaniense TaxID=302449 RepID=UPI001478E44E